MPSISGDSRTTRFKVLHSDTGLYVLFECEDSTITSTLVGEHQDLWKEDVFELFIWTDRRHPLYFEYELSPRNYELVLLVPKIDGTFLGWIPWHYTDERKIQHRISMDDTPRGVTWMGEFYIPYELLKPLANVPPDMQTTWYMNFYRIDYDAGTALWAWKSVKGTFHQPEKFGSVTFTR